ncbi:MAG TPA: GNAT family N-acetyltransferase [Cytophagales bacterium]|nr:GNAT family N-acetyltransferase [Cytophagales bacterium]
MEIIKASLTQLDIIVPLFNQYRVFYNQLSDEKRAKDFLKERIENKESEIFVAVEESVAVGFIQLYPSFSSISLKRLWILNDLFVLPEFRKRSAASKLIIKAIHFAKETSAIGLVLETGKTNEAAQKLYNKLGFSKSEDFYVYYYSL